jgi:TRAP-type C4-dicarboxylate transport system permease large subunit
MPSAILYLGVMLAVISVWFLVLKRPVYEAVLVSFIILVALTNGWSNIFQYISGGLSTSLLYSMVAFVAMSQLLTKTKVIDSTIAIILALLGRVTGGAGYVSVVASSFMGAISGSGPGNVMTTGTITIPAMIKSGFPRELAANIESTSSYLGNAIPPSANIAAAIGAFMALYPESTVTTGQFWVVLWGIALYFIVQRIFTVYFFCKYYKVKPMQKEDLPNLKETIRDGWKALLLPIIILAPFVFDFLFKETFLTQRLGATGAKHFSSSLLLFVAGLAAIYTVLIAKDRSTVSIRSMVSTFNKGIKSLAPAIGTCLFGYMIGKLFVDMNVSAELETFITSLSFSKLSMVLFITVLTTFLGMVIPGSSLVVMFGPMFISLFAVVGINPLLAAAMLPSICGVMCGITPPLALGLYAGMSLAESDFTKTVINDLWWVALQYGLQLIILMGWLPILGL